MPDESVMTLKLPRAAANAYERLRDDTNFLYWRDDEIQEKLEQMRRTVLTFLGSGYAVSDHNGEELAG